MIILFLLKDGSIKTFEINGISVNGILKLITFDRVDHCIDFNLFILTNDKSLFLDCQLDTEICQVQTNSLIPFSVKYK